MKKSKTGVLTYNANNSNIIDGYIFCRYRRVKNSDRYLDAHDYGYEVWRIPIKK